jgi:hypothetical protein
MTDSGPSGAERLGGATTRLMDRLAEFGEGAVVEVVVALASVCLSDGTRRVEWVYEPGEDEVATRALRPALASLEHGIGERRKYPPPETDPGAL